MTNGEKIIEIVGKKPFIDTFSNPYMLFNKNWWNTEYKEPNTKNDLKEVYNKGYEDGVKSVNICPYCGEYIGEEDGNDN